MTTPKELMASFATLSQSNLNYSIVVTDNFRQDTESTTGLDFYYKSGSVRSGTTVTDVADCSVTLTDDSTNYIEVAPATGIVSANNVGFSAGTIPLFTVVTASGAISSVQDDRAYFQADYGQALTSTSSPTFAGLTLTGLTASRLLSTNGSNALTSVSSLSSWVAGTASQITVTNDGDGTITLSTPQNIATASSPAFQGLTLNGMTASQLLTVTAGKAVSSVSDLSAYVAATANQTTVTNDGDGTITLGTVQNIGTTSYPEFAGLLLSDFESEAFVANAGGALVSNTRLTALSTYNTDGILTQTADATYTGRTITGTANQVTVSNGNGVAGNPTLSLPQSIATTSDVQFNKIGLGAAATYQVDSQTASSYIRSKSTTVGNEAGVIIDGNVTTDISIAHIYANNNGTNVGGLRFIRDGANDTSAFTVWTRTTGAGAAAERLRINSTGNIGIGSTDIEAWNAMIALESVKTAITFGTTVDNLEFFSNCYYDGNYKYKSNGKAAQYYLYDGTHNWRVASAGVANAAITWAEKLSINATGVMVGTGTVSDNFNVADGTSIFKVGLSSGAYIGTRSNHGLFIQTNNATVAQWSTSGNLKMYSNATNLLTLQDTNGQTTGVGAKIEFRGYYTDAGNEADGGLIELYKENSTSGNTAFSLRFHTRANGVATALGMTLSSAKSLTVVNNIDAASYSVGGTVGATGSGTNVTVVNGIVTAVS